MTDVSIGGCPGIPLGVLAAAVVGALADDVRAPDVGGLAAVDGRGATTTDSSPVIVGTVAIAVTTGGFFEGAGIVAGARVATVGGAVTTGAVGAPVVARTGAAVGLAAATAVVDVVFAAVVGALVGPAAATVVAVVFSAVVGALVGPAAATVVDVVFAAIFAAFAAAFEPFLGSVFGCVSGAVATLAIARPGTGIAATATASFDSL